MLDSLETLEEYGIVYSDIVFNPDENRTEQIFYSKKTML